MLVIAVIFALGVGNFALHKAVMESDHPMTRQITWFSNPLGKKVAFALEFGVLFVALLLAANGWPDLVWGYLIYSGLNGLSAWLILNGRI